MKKITVKQYVELFHLLFLNQLSRKLDKKLYALKGGCNMRFYFQSIRYSEDMDIDIHIVNKETLAKNVNQILNSAPFKNILKSNDIIVESFSSVKQTDTTQRWKILIRIPNSALPLPTKIEFSRRSTISDVNFELINANILSLYSLPTMMCNHYSKFKMFDQKILALALRSQVQARDVFDLYFLISSGIERSDLSIETSENISLAITNAKSISFADYNSKVVAYLSSEYKDYYSDQETWHLIVKTVINELESYA